MTLGRRCYEALLASGALPFGEMSRPWGDLPDAVREQYEAAGRIVDAATRADVVGQVRAWAAEVESYGDDGHEAIREAADRVEAGR